MPVTSPGCYLLFWLTGYKSEALTSSLGSINLLDWLTEPGKPIYSLDLKKGIKGYESTVRWRDTESKVKGKVAQSCPTLCDPMKIAHGILQARILEWVAVPSSRGSFQPRDQAQVSDIAGGFFTSSPPGKPLESKVPNRGASALVELGAWQSSTWRSFFRF